MADRWTPSLASAVAALGVLIAGPASATSPWIPDQWDLDATGSFVYETFDEFYDSDERNDYPAGELNQYTTRLFFDFGVGYDLAFDLSVGYSGTQSPDVPGDGGLDDTFVGLRWRALDELESERRWMPTLSLRVGGVIAGSYDTDKFPAAVGVGGSGVEANVALGKLLPMGFVASSELGYRIRDNDVPDDWQTRVSVSKALFEGLSVQLGFDHAEATGGVDVDDADFTPDRSPELREIYSNLEAGLTAIDSRGFRYGLFYAYTLDGRNAGRKDIISATFTVPFRFGAAR